MRSTILALSAALVLAAPAAGAPPSDFRLPPDPSTTQPPPDRQGPVAPDVPESRRPSPTPTPTVTASRAAPAPTVTPPEIVLPAAGTPPAPAPARRTAAAPTNALPAATETATPEPVPSQSPVPSAPAPQTAPATSSQAEGGGSAWLWLAVLLVLAGGGFAGWMWRQRQRGVSPAKVPQIERPRLSPGPAPIAPPTSPTGLPAAVEPLQVALEPLRLSLTLMNATLSYRLEIANHGLTPLTGLAIGADMISAHASMSREEQLAGPHKAAAPLHRIERLEPGESRVVEGEFRVPFSQIVPIRQGNAALLLPLARFRVETEGARPIVRTFVVGQPGEGAGLQPFRLDQGPRVYPRLAQRAFA